MTPWSAQTASSSRRTCRTAEAGEPERTPARAAVSSLRTTGGTSAAMGPAVLRPQHGGGSGRQVVGVAIVEFLRRFQQQRLPAALAQRQPIGTQSLGQKNPV
ncbi:hypothetical protein GCM10020219_008260 [Nonomuraea dietziae]